MLICGRCDAKLDQSGRFVGHSAEDCVVELRAYIKALEERVEGLEALGVSLDRGEE